MNSVPESPQTRFGSLAELLASIGGMSLNDAHPIASEEYALALERIGWIERFRKVRPQKEDPRLVDYKWDVALLLSNMEGKHVGPDLGTEHARELIKGAMSKWQSHVPT